MASEAPGATAATSAVPNPTPAPSPEGHGNQSFWALALGSIGVVFGDIGTSPLYAMREALAHSKNSASTEHAVLGVVSLVIWALFLVVTVKYVVLLMRADNKGEGGHAGPDGPGPSDPEQADGQALGRGLLPRRHRRGAVLWRRRDHSGHLGALRHGGPQGRAGHGRPCRSLYSADLGRDPRRTVHGAVARDPQGGLVLRPDHPGLVPRFWALSASGTWGKTSRSSAPSTPGMACAS